MKNASKLSIANKYRHFSQLFTKAFFALIISVFMMEFYVLPKDMDVIDSFIALFTYDFISYLIKTSLFWIPLSLLVYFFYAKQAGVYRDIKEYSDFDYSKSYTLYLRAFEKDRITFKESLGRTIGIYNYEPNSSRFMERCYLSVLTTFKRLVVVNNPGQLSESIATEYSDDCIYLNNVTWENDVANLICKAENVHILVSSRDSCVIEILKAANYLDKTYFIIDDLNEYKLAFDKAKLSHLIINATSPFCVNYKDNIPTVWRFKNSAYSYDHLIKEIDDFSSKSKSYPHYGSIVDCLLSLADLYTYKVINTTEQEQKAANIRIVISVIPTLIFFICSIVYGNWSEVTIWGVIILICIKLILSFAVWVGCFLFVCIIESCYKQIKKLYR